MKIKTNEHIQNVLEILKNKRDVYVFILQQDLSTMNDENFIRGEFNGKLNMVQFIIDNIYNLKEIDKNPYFWKWIDEEIEYNKNTNLKTSRILFTFKEIVKNHNFL